jgi:hypothetical protein
MRRISLGPLFALVLMGSHATMLCLSCGSAGSVGSGPNTGGSGGEAGAYAGGGGAGGVVITLPSSGGNAGLPGVVGDGGGALDGGPPAVLCGNTTITPDRAPVDVLIVLDRSASMYYSIAEDCYCVASIGGGATGPLCANATNCSNRWDAVSSALGQTMNAMPTLHWGIEMFSTPGAGACTVSATPQVAFGTADSAAAVQSAIARGAPTGNTPTAAAIQAATAYLPTLSDGYKKAILLATDGAPNCYGGDVNNIDDMPATLEAIAAAYALDIPVYVVGIGPSVGNLDSMAQAGGTGSYYPASSPQQLFDALSAISKIVATTCTFQTPMPPPDDSKVWVYVDKQLVEEDAADGWAFGATSSTIVLTGNTCQNLLAGAASSVQVIFGCPDEAPPPVIP